MFTTAGSFDADGALTPIPISVPVSESAGGKGGSDFGAIPAIAIVEREVDWLVPNAIPLGMISALIGEEGVGKGLFTCLLIAQVTTGESPGDVLLIAGEDDHSMMLRPRLRAAGADLTRVHFFTRKGAPGMPSLPEELAELQDLARGLKVSLIVIDPWLSVISAKKRVRDSQEARQVFDDLALVVKALGIGCLLVGHTNRSESGSARNRYGGSIVIRQVARFTSMAIPDPSDPQSVIIGVDKSNISAIEPATRYLKSCADGAWFLGVHSDQYGRTIPQHLGDLEQFDRRGDRRRSKHEAPVRALLNTHGSVSRQEIVEIFEASGSSASMADKAIERWTTGSDPLMVWLARGRYGPAGPSLPPEPPAPTTSGELEPW